MCAFEWCNRSSTHNEARPFAVTPPHQEDREARSEGRNKKAGSEKEKEGARGRIKNGGEKQNGRGESLTAGSANSRTWQRRQCRWGRLSVSEQDGLRREDFSQKPEKMQREREREPERERGEEGWPLTWGHYREGDYGCSELSKHSPRDPS